MSVCSSRGIRRLLGMHLPSGHSQLPVDGMSWRSAHFVEEVCSRRSRWNWPAEMTTSLDALIAMAILLDNLLRKCRHLHRFSPSFSKCLGSVSEPMEVAVTHLPAAEGTTWIQLGFCLYCGQGGHKRQRCPLFQNLGSTRAERWSRDVTSPGPGVSIPSTALPDSF